MALMETLRKDHRALRQALTELEEVLKAARPTETVVDRCQALACLLQTHVRGEERTLAPYANRIQAAMREHLLPDQVDPRAVLQDLQELLAMWRVISTGTLLIHLCQLLDEVREYLDDEEREVFPIAEAAARVRRPRRRPQ